jgi:hypothetical protein
MGQPPPALGIRSLSPCDGAGSAFVRVDPLPGTSMTLGVTVATSNRITMAAGQVTPADKIVITFVRATEAPDAIMIHWPRAPSITNSNPKALASSAKSLVRMLARSAGATRQDQHERKTIMNHFKYPTSESSYPGRAATRKRSSGAHSVMIAASDWLSVFSRATKIATL